MKVGTGKLAVATIALVGLLCTVSATPVAAQTQCETPNPAGISMCLDSPAFQSNLEYRFHTRLLVALGVDYYKNPAWISAVSNWLTGKINLTGKTGTLYNMDWYFTFLFGQSVGTALAVHEPMDIYLLMGQSNMYLHGNGPQLKAAIQDFTDAITQALGGADRTVVTINCAIPGSPMIWWDPQPSALHGSPTCETAEALARCADPEHDTDACDPENPQLCSCDYRDLDFCSDGVSWLDARRFGSGYLVSPILTGDARDRYNLTRHCLEVARTLKNSAGQTGVVKGMFYYQGESDTGSAETVASWGDSYKNIVAFLRTSLGSQIPVIHAQIRGGSNPSALWQQLQVEQRLVQAEISKSAFVCTNDLGVFDGVHIDGPGHVILGNRFGSAMLHLLLGWPYNPAADGCNPT